MGRPPVEDLFGLAMPWSPVKAAMPRQDRGRNMTASPIPRPVRGRRGEHDWVDRRSVTCEFDAKPVG